MLVTVTLQSLDRDPRGHNRALYNTAMSVPAAEQTVHNRINLGRLVKRLESSISEENWDQDKRHDTWIKAQGTLQASFHIRFAT